MLDTKSFMLEADTSVCLEKKFAVAGKSLNYQWNTILPFFLIIHYYFTLNIPNNMIYIGDDN